MDLLIHFQGFDWCTCWNTYMSPQNHNSREQDADMWIQPQLERPSVLKSRWAQGLKVWSIWVQHICDKLSRGKWLVRMEPKSGGLIVADDGGYAHLSHTHFSFVRVPTRNCQPFSGSNPNTEKDRVLVLCQVLPVSDYLLSYFQDRVRDGFSTKGPDPA